MAQQGHTVVGIDIDPMRLKAAREASEFANPPITWVLADLENRLPNYDETFDLAVVVDFSSSMILASVTPAIKSDGYLVFETFGGRGQNWRILPKTGTTRPALETHFDIVDYNERTVGPKGTHGAVKTLARKKIKQS